MNQHEIISFETCVLEQGGKHLLLNGDLTASIRKTLNTTKVQYTYKGKRITPWKAHDLMREMS